MIPTFLELYKKDITEHVKKRFHTKKLPSGEYIKDDAKPPMEYLEWSRVLVMLYELGATSVAYGNDYNPDGHPVFLSKSGAAPFVKVWVRIDENTFYISHPVLNGMYLGYADNQLHIHTASQRAFVKCVAINTGLGLSLWEKEEEKTIMDESEVESKDANNELNLKLLKVFNSAIRKLGSDTEVHTQLSTNKKFFRDMLKGDNIVQKQEYIDKITELLIL